ncbi:MAG: tail fiber protein [Paludibacteraceae bacterium]|nr:tail fiber protein [Paludibacteraceae bacterium]
MNTLNLTKDLTNYPLTIEGIKLLQDAIALATSGVLTGASSTGCFIVSGCTETSIGNGNTTTSPGILLIDGELYNFDGATTQTYIQIASTPEAVTVGQVGYQNARTIKTISFTGTKDGTCYEWAKFTRIQTNVDMYNLIKSNGIDQMKQAESNYLVPKGAIIMWSGNPDKIPLGWALCDGWYYNPTNSADKVMVSDKSPTDTTHTFLSPDLQGRFVVGFWNKTDSTPDSTGTPGLTNYGAIGNTGGEISTTDIISHTHSYINDDAPRRCQPLVKAVPWMVTENSFHNLIGQSNLNDNNNGTDGFTGYLGDMISDNGCKSLGFYPTSQPLKTRVDGPGNGTSIDVNNGYFENSQQLDNRPPYYVLAYIIKL